MAKAPIFTLSFAPEAVGHLKSIERKHHGLIRDTIERQLCRTPHVETRNRKPLEPPTPWGAVWELRFGPANRFRVFYEFDAASHTVGILAVGVKEGSRLCVGGEEIDL